MEACGPKKKPKPRTHVAIPAFFLENTQSSFCTPLPVWRPSHLPDSVLLPLPVAPWGELSHGPSLASLQYKANGIDAGGHAVSERGAAPVCTAAFWQRPHSVLQTWNGLDLPG